MMSAIMLKIYDVLPHKHSLPPSVFICLFLFYSLMSPKYSNFPLKTLFLSINYSGVMFSLALQLQFRKTITYHSGTVITTRHSLHDII